MTGGQAQAAARMHALRGNLTCTQKALHYSCHLAPWGFMSGDLSEYMHWNGNFAALLFINAWEYERNETFARAQAYPLLDGLNAWWSCFLTKRVLPDGRYVYEDASRTDPDQEHENQNCSNPQIGVALVRRTFSAQLSMAKALGITPDPKYADILAHLAPLNTAVCGTTGEPNVQTGATCTPGQTLWMQCGASINSTEGDSRIKASDGYSLYGLFPAEIVQVGASTEAELQTARDSILYYGLGGASWGMFGGGPGSINPVHQWSMMARAGYPGNVTLATLTQHLKGFGHGNFVPWIFTEQLGISLAVCDMLVQAPNGDYILLFPAWDRSQDASFTNLLVKGAVEVSASWSASKKQASGVSIVARKEHIGEVRIRGLACTVKIKCADGSAPQPTTAGDMTSFAAPPGVRCTLVGSTASSAVRLKLDDNDAAAGVGCPGTDVFCAKCPKTDVRASRVFRATPEPGLVPFPRSASVKSLYVDIPLPLKLADITVGNPSLQSLAALLLAEVAARTNTSGATAAAQTHSNDGPIIKLAVNATRVYSSIVVSSHNGVVLTGSSNEGLLAAMTTFIQALELSADTDTGRQPLITTRPSFGCSTTPRWRVPVLVATDTEPEKPFRGMLSDVARKPVSLLQLKKLVVMCRFYKLNHLHLHMSDNEAVVWPSTAFPTLGKSGWQKTMGKPQYTLADMRELQSFAALRGVTILAELDLPGHGTGFTCAAPDDFAFQSSRNTSCEPNQITNFLSPATVKRFQTLLDEVAAVFPSPVMHIGGDELQWWRIDNLTEVADALKATGMASDRDLYRAFIEKMRVFAVSRNKTLHVWEGFGPKQGQAGHMPTSDTGFSPPSTVVVNPESLVVEAFDGTSYNPLSLVEDGYQIINTMTTPLYVDQPTSPQLIWQWNPMLFGQLTYANEAPGWESWWEIPEGPGRAAVRGVQTAAWDLPGTAQIERMRLNMPAFSERSWCPESGRNFADFSFRAAKADAALAALLAAVDSYR
eukprot:SAG22_NODE_146_length_17566_cov_17.597847_5_plen_993_part_00